MSELETFMSICLGLGLSAACGFRIFVPLLGLSIGAITGHIQLSNSFAWIGTYPALIVFAVATIAEITAYYVPFVDNLLDSIAVPAATVAGIMVTSSVVTGMDPFWRWTLAVIAGGGVAATTQIATTKLRAASSAMTGGLGNSVLSTVEGGMSTGLSALAVLSPVLAFIVVLCVLTACWLLIYFVGKKLITLFQKKSPPVINLAPQK